MPSSFPNLDFNCISITTSYREWREGIVTAHLSASNRGVRLSPRRGGEPRGVPFAEVYPPQGRIVEETLFCANLNADEWQLETPRFDAMATGLAHVSDVVEVEHIAGATPSDVLFDDTELHRVAPGARRAVSRRRPSLGLIQLALPEPARGRRVPSGAPAVRVRTEREEFVLTLEAAARSDGARPSMVLVQSVRAFKAATRQGGARKRR